MRGVLVCVVSLIVGFLLMPTVARLYKGTGSISEGTPAVAEVGECTRRGPIGRGGLGYYWDCRVTVWTSDGAVVKTEVKRSIVTPADHRVIFRESCDSDDCDYGRPSFWLWPVLLIIAGLAWRITIIGLIYGTVLFGWAAVTGRVPETDTAEPVLGPRPTVRKAESPEPGLTLELTRPEGVALYDHARPFVRIGDDVHELPGWGTHTFPLAPGRYRVEIIAVLRGLPLHNTKTTTSVRVRRDKGAIVRYEALDLSDLGAPAAT
uniref:Uncharacterized protein n=1 Tax=uncultured bacterium BAC AB649/1850 TaxID=1037453 RepID=F6K113_9BACT|nr:hypothetical protein [uncultured bacterium BAC AB649/1850]